MIQKEKFSEEEVKRACAEIRRNAELENARWQLKVGYGILAFMLVVLIAVLCCGDSWKWWWLSYFVLPVMLVVNARRILRGKRPW